MVLKLPTAQAIAACLALTVTPAMAVPTGVLQCKTAWAQYSHDGKSEPIPAAKGMVTEYTVGADFIVARQLVPLDTPLMVPCFKPTLKDWSDLTCEVTLSHTGDRVYKNESFEVFIADDPPGIMRWSVISGPDGLTTVQSSAQCSWTSGGR
jgi:hypothetical protein